MILDNLGNGLLSNFVLFWRNEGIHSVKQILFNKFMNEDKIVSERSYPVKTWQNLLSQELGNLIALSPGPFNSFQILTPTDICSVLINVKLSVPNLPCVAARGRQSQLELLG